MAVEKCRETGLGASCTDEPFLERIAQAYGVQTEGQGRGPRRSGDLKR